ncbi:MULTISPECIES: helix-turn-helix domain-containing protein, partial [unclassified Moraxella]|uniref:helix-turn-helix domain-containing protein n=1 Tax=unclassified Moraxella TaxID=2685852 RepID=UPI00359D2CDD
MLPISHNQKSHQAMQVLQAMLDGVEVHIKYAINTMNIASLSARIAELKKMGFVIDWRWEISPNSRYKVYFIKDKTTAKQRYQEILNGTASIHQVVAQARTAKPKTTKAKTKRQNNGKPQGK